MQLLPSTEIVVRDFRVILLWPLRIEGHGKLFVDRKDPDVGAAKWLSSYSEWIKSTGVWVEIPDYYKDAGRAHEPTEEERYSEFLYFHPFIQRCFYSPEQPVRTLKRTDIRAARVVLGGRDHPWLCGVERLNLFLFPTDIAILAIQLDNPVAEGPANPFFLSDAMDFLDWVRRIYPPWFDTRDGKLSSGGTPTSVEWIGAQNDRRGDASNYQSTTDFLEFVREKRTTPVASHWRTLLEPLLPMGTSRGEPYLTYAQVEDDRLPLCASVAVDDPRSISHQDWVRLAFCDSHGNSEEWPYSSKFLRDFERQNCYDRFWEAHDDPDPKKSKTTRFLISGYSFITVGRRGDWFFDANVVEHLQQHYFLLCVLAHLQKASLLSFWSRLAAMLHEHEQDGQNRASQTRLIEAQEWLLHDLTDFVSRFYFREVSNQLQAIELFDIIGAKLRIKELFQDVVEQSEFVGGILFEKWERESTEKQTQLAHLAKESTGKQTQLAQLANRWLPAVFTVTLLGLSLGLPTVQNQIENWLGKDQGFSWAKVATGAGFALVSFLAAWLAVLGLIWVVRKAVSNERRPAGDRE
jgi:hypothetical protein